eukprot:21598_1
MAKVLILVLLLPLTLADRSRHNTYNGGSGKSSDSPRVPVPYPDFVNCSYENVYDYEPPTKSYFLIRSFRAESGYACKRACCDIPNCATAALIDESYGQKCYLYNRRMKLRKSKYGGSKTWRLDIRRYGECTCATDCLDTTQQCLSSFNNTDEPDIPDGYGKFKDDYGGHGKKHHGGGGYGKRYSGGGDHGRRNNYGGGRGGGGGYGKTQQYGDRGNYGGYRSGNYLLGDDVVGPTLMAVELQQSTRLLLQRHIAACDNAFVLCCPGDVSATAEHVAKLTWCRNSCSAALGGADLLSYQSGGGRGYGKPKRLRGIESVERPTDCLLPTRDFFPPKKKSHAYGYKKHKLPEPITGPDCQIANNCRCPSTFIDMSIGETLRAAAVRGVPFDSFQRCMDGCRTSGLYHSGEDMAYCTLLCHNRFEKLSRDQRRVYGDMFSVALGSNYQCYQDLCPAGYNTMCVPNKKGVYRLRCVKGSRVRRFRQRGAFRPGDTNIDDKYDSDCECSPQTESGASLSPFPEERN